MITRVLNDKSLLPTVLQPCVSGFCIHQGENGNVRLSTDGRWVHQEEVTASDDFLFKTEEDAVVFWENLPKSHIRFFY